MVDNLPQHARANRISGNLPQITGGQIGKRICPKSRLEHTLICPNITHKLVNKQRRVVGRSSYSSRTEMWSSRPISETVIRKHASFSSGVCFPPHSFPNNKEQPSARLPRGGATGHQEVAAGSFPSLSQATPSQGVGSHV